MGDRSAEHHVLDVAINKLGIGRVSEDYQSNGYQMLRTKYEIQQPRTVGLVEVIYTVKMVAHLIAENHEQHNDIRIVEVAEIVSRVATKRVKDGLHGFRPLSYKAFQFALPVEPIGQTCVKMQ